MPVALKMEALSDSYYTITIYLGNHIFWGMTHWDQAWEKPLGDSPGPGYLQLPYENQRDAVVRASK